MSKVSSTMLLIFSIILAGIAYWLLLLAIFLGFIESVQYFEPRLILIIKGKNLMEVIWKRYYIHLLISF